MRAAEIVRNGRRMTHRSYGQPLEIWRHSRSTTSAGGAAFVGDADSRRAGVAGCVREHRESRTGVWGARQHEISVGLAPGASRWRLVRQLSVEGLALAVVGAVCGFLLAQWGTRCWFNSSLLSGALGSASTTRT
jgi:hypothetical protein